MSEHPPTPYNEDDVVDGVEDFDAWREQQEAKRGRGKRVRVFGKIVSLPTTLPLGLHLSMDEMKSIDDVRGAVGALYGPDAFDHWIDAGVTFEEFKILVAYATAHGAGQAVTLDRAAELVVEAEKKQAAKEKAAAGKAKAAKKPKKKRGPGGGSPAAGR